MRLTPRRLAVIYDHLAALPPYSAWRMWPSKLLDFATSDDPDFYGRFTAGDDYAAPMIEINPEQCFTFDEVLRTMAHEMLHLRQYTTGSLRPLRNGGHDKKFYRMARKVCRSFDWDTETF